MEFLRRYWTQVAEHLGELSATQKWLILSLTVILLLSGFVMLQYAATPELVPISGFSSDPGSVVAHLNARGVEVQSENGQLLVPRDQVHTALFHMEQGRLLRPDTSAAFDELIQNISPFMSESTKAEYLLIARQKVLASIIGKMQNVDSADVLVSKPSGTGFGETHEEPSASVSVVMKPSAKVTQAMVKAIAGLVSGANAPMKAQNVVVIDANRAQSFTVKDEHEVPPGDTYVLRKQIESQTRDKVLGLLNIPGLIVAVKVETDSDLREEFMETIYQTEDQVAGESTRETMRREVADGGEPGARSNAGASIAGGGEALTTETTEETETTFSAKQPTITRRRVTLGHQITSTRVSLNIPQIYFEALQGLPRRDDAEEDVEATPLDQQLVSDELANLEAFVKNIVEVTDGECEVHARMMADTLALMPFSGGGGQSAGLMQFVGSSWIKTGGISLLALVSLALMFGMVRRATAPPDLPTVEELAGLPPALGEDELIGEASPTGTVIDGVEIGDDEMRSRKIAEQIGDLIQANPEEAGSLLGRWVRPDA